MFGDVRAIDDGLMVSGTTSLQVCCGQITQPYITAAIENYKKRGQREKGKKKKLKK